MKNIAEANTTDFSSNFVKNLKGHNLPLLCFILDVVGILIKASTWYLQSWKISANEIDFWQILLKIESAAILCSMDTEASSFQVMLYLW